MMQVRSVEVRPGDRIIGFDGRTVELVADVVGGHGDVKGASGYVTLFLVPRSGLDIGQSRTLWASDMVTLV